MNYNDDFKNKLKNSQEKIATLKEEQDTISEIYVSAIKNQFQLNDGDFIKFKDDILKFNFATLDIEGYRLYSDSIIPDGVEPSPIEDFITFFCSSVENDKVIEDTKCFSLNQFNEYGISVLFNFKGVNNELY